MQSPRRLVSALLIFIVIAGCGSNGAPPAGTAPVGGDPSASLGSTPTVRPLPSIPVGSPVPTPSALVTASPTPTPDPAIADMTYDPAKFGFRAKGMTGEMMVFMPGSQIRYALDEMDWDVVSTVAFFSLEAGKDGQILEDAGWKVWNTDRMTSLITRAHATGTKVVMSVE